MVLAGTDSNQILPLPLPQRQRVDRVEVDCPGLSSPKLHALATHRAAGLGARP